MSTLIRLQVLGLYLNNGVPHNKALRNADESVRWVLDGTLPQVDTTDTPTPAKKGIPLTTDDGVLIERLLASGVSYEAISADLGRETSTVYAYASRKGITKRWPRSTGGGGCLFEPYPFDSPWPPPNKEGCLTLDAPTASSEKRPAENESADLGTMKYGGSSSGNQIENNLTSTGTEKAQVSEEPELSVVIEDDNSSTAAMAIVKPIADLAVCLNTAAADGQPVIDANKGIADWGIGTEGGTDLNRHTGLTDAVGAGPISVALSQPDKSPTAHVPMARGMTLADFTIGGTGTSKGIEVSAEAKLPNLDKMVTPQAPPVEVRNQKPQAGNGTRRNIGPMTASEKEAERKLIEAHMADYKPAIEKRAAISDQPGGEVGIAVVVAYLRNDGDDITEAGKNLWLVNGSEHCSIKQLFDKANQRRKRGKKPPFILKK